MAAGDAATSGALEQTIAFESAADCRPSEAFRVLLGQLAPQDLSGKPADVETIAMPDIPGVTFGTPTLTSEDYTHEMHVPVTAGWHGLNVTGLAQYWGEESDFGGFAIEFAEDPETVIRALNGLGFVLPPSGERETDEDLPTVIAVQDHDQGSMLTCGT